MVLRRLRRVCAGCYSTYPRCMVTRWGCCRLVGWFASREWGQLVVEKNR